MSIFIQPIGKAELAKRRADGADVAKERAIDVEDGNAVIAGVGDVENIVVNHHGLWPGEFHITLAEAADHANDFERNWLEDLNPVVVAVFRNVDVACVVEGDVGGVDELSCLAAECPPIL